jgi:hypothetical protein
VDVLVVKERDVCIIDALSIKNVGFALTKIGQKLPIEVPGEDFSLC